MIVINNLTKYWFYNKESKSLKKQWYAYKIGTST